MGRRRQFWSRLNDNSTLRQAIAYVPQSTIGDLLNLGLLKVWKNLKHTGLDILAQVHDAILGQCDIDKVDTLMPQVLEQMNNPLEIKGAFPGIRTWHMGVSNELKQTGCLITPMGRRRQFWSRLNDNSTLREAIAYVP